jgi:hypothetical protein
MHDRVDVSLLTPLRAMAGDCAEDTRLLKQMAKEARAYLLSFRWCKGIRRGWFGWGVGGVCAVFFFEILPSRKTIDRRLWVIVGDLPPAYLVVDGSPNPREALGTYVELMQEWVDAIKKGKSVDRCIPVNVLPTRTNANALRRRLDFLRKNALS